MRQHRRTTARAAWVHLCKLPAKCWTIVRNIFIPIGWCDRYRRARRGCARSLPWRPGNVARILVIEDNQENLELMTYLLKVFGHATVTADDGNRGLELALREQPDLIVCDIHLPGADGYEVVRQLKA